MKKEIFSTKELDSGVCSLILDFAKQMKIPPHVVVQNLIINWMAQRQARNNIFGECPHGLEEFIFIDDQVITGKPLFDTLTEQFEKKFKEEKEKLLLEEEKNGIPLEEDEKAFLIKRRKGQAWYNSNEFKQSQAEVKNIDALVREARESGLIPGGKGKNDNLLAMYWKSYKAGKMTKENLLKQLDLDENVKMGWVKDTDSNNNED